jgi:hypothetical protein
MKREIWEFLFNGTDGVMAEWFREAGITPKERAKLDVALERLRTLDFELVSKKLLAGPLHGTKVYKLRLRCENRELRPMLCRGPVGSPLDYTLLLGAIEVGDRPRPPDAEARADRNRQTLKERPTWRKLYGR